MAVTDLLLNETQTLYVLMPAPHHWEHIPTLYDEFEEEGAHLDQDAYDVLTPERRRQYERANPSESDARYKRMRKRYRLNSAGETDDGSPDFEVDHRRGLVPGDRRQDGIGDHAL